MEKEISLNDLYREILALKNEVESIKINIITSDEIMTDEDELLLTEALEEHKRGETVSIEELKLKFGV
jgi:hypothetical protein